MGHDVSRLGSQCWGYGTEGGSVLTLRGKEREWFEPAPLSLERGVTMLATLKEALSEEKKISTLCILGVFLILIFMLSASRFFAFLLSRSSTVPSGLYPNQPEDI